MLYLKHLTTDTAGSHERTALTSSFQLFGYADDIALIARILPDLKGFFTRLEKAAKEVLGRFKVSTLNTRMPELYVR
jgi:hypothetical protein